MDEVLLSEVRPAIALWSLVIMVVLVWTIFCIISRAKQVKYSKKDKEKVMRIFYSVISFLFLWIAVLPFFIYGACGVLPDIQGWFLTIIALMFAICVLLNIKSRRKK